MEKINVQSIVGNTEDPEEIFEMLMGEVDTKLSFTEEREFEFDFQDVYLDSLDYIENKISEEVVASATKFTFKFINTQDEEDLFGDKMNVAKVVDEYLGKRISIDNLEAQLTEMIEDSLKRTGACILELVNMIVISRSSEGRSVTVPQGTRLSTSDRGFILLLAKLKAKYGGDLMYVGIDIGVINKLNFLMNFLTLGPENKFMYGENDFVFIHELKLVPKVIEKKDEIYSARKHDNPETLYERMARAEALASNLELGIITSIDEDSVTYTPVKVMNDRDYSETKRAVQFKAEIEPEEKTIAMEDLRSRKYAIHGVDQTNEATQLYELVKTVNPPRDRAIFYTEEGVGSYLKLTTPEDALRKSHIKMDKMDDNVLRKLRENDIKVHSVTSNL